MNLIFWICVVLLSGGTLIYRAVTRRKLNSNLSALPAVYKNACSTILSDPDAILREHRNAPMLAAVTALMENEGLSSPKKFELLAPKEVRLFELAQAACVMDNMQYSVARKKLRGIERDALDQFWSFRKIDTTSRAGKIMAQLEDKKRAKIEAKKTLEREQAEKLYWASVTYKVVHKDLLEWLQQEAPRDPILWHKLPHLNWDYEEIYKVLLWVVQQPECDASTAIDILHLGAPDVDMDLASGGTRWIMNTWDQTIDYTNTINVKLLKSICERSEGQGFENHVLPQSERGNGSLLKMIESAKSEIENAGRTVPFPIPQTLLSLPEIKNIELPSSIYEIRDDKVVWPKS